MYQFCSQSHREGAHSDCYGLDSTSHSSRSATANFLRWSRECERVIGTPYVINLVAELMEPIHAELVRLANDVDTVRGQVHTEYNGEWRSQQDRRLQRELQAPDPARWSPLHSLPPSLPLPTHTPHHHRTTTAPPPHHHRTTTAPPPPPPAVSLRQVDLCIILL